MLPLSIDFINRASRYELVRFFNDNGLSISIAGEEFSSIAARMLKEELREYFLGIPHVRNRDPSWLDLFISIRDRGIVIDTRVTKKQMKKLLSGVIALEDLPVDELLEMPPSWIHVRFLANRFGYVKRNCRKKVHELCEMIGLPCLEYGYQREVILLAKYFGLTDAEQLPSKFSFEFLGMQPYPKTIRELSNIDEERFNRDVIIVKESLKSVIHSMQRTKLVKLILTKYRGHKYSCAMTSQELSIILEEEEDE